LPLLKFQPWYNIHSAHEDLYIRSWSFPLRFLSCKV